MPSTTKFFSDDLVEISSIADKVYLQDHFIKYLNQFVLKVTKMDESPRFDLDESGNAIAGTFQYDDAIRIVAALYKVKQISVHVEISDPLNTDTSSSLNPKITHIHPDELTETNWYTRFRNLQPKGYEVSEQVVIERLEASRVLSAEALRSI